MHESPNGVDGTDPQATKLGRPQAREDQEPDSWLVRIPHLGDELVNLAHVEDVGLPNAPPPDLDAVSGRWVVPTHSIAAC